MVKTFLRTEKGHIKNFKNKIDDKTNNSRQHYLYMLLMTQKTETHEHDLKFKLISYDRERQACHVQFLPFVVFIINIINGKFLFYNQENLGFKLVLTGL